MPKAFVILVAMSGSYRGPWLQGIIGARPSFSGSPFSVSEFAERARRLGYGFIAFVDDGEKLCRYWDSVLHKGARFNVPEPPVMNAMRNLLIQNLFMGWRHSIGNAYERWYPYESHEAVKVLGEYGLLDAYRGNLQCLLGKRFPERFWLGNWAEKLLYGAHYFWLTRDGDFTA